MAALNVSGAEAAIANATSSVVQQAAQTALSLAENNGSQNLVDAIQGVLGQSATGNGTAIFYSRATGSNANLSLAQACQQQLGNSNSYLFQDTQAGAYTLNPSVANGLSSTESSSLQSIASAMIGAEAKGPAIAFVNGATNVGSDWLQYELPALLQTNSSVINGLSSNGLSIINNAGSPLLAISAQVGALAQCFSQDNQPPTGTAPVTPPAGSTSSTALNAALAVVAAAGLAALALGVVAAAPVEIGAATIAAGVALLASSAAASASPSAPTSDDAGSAFLYQAQIDAFTASQVAPGLAYALTASQVASGSLSPAVIDQIFSQESSLQSLQSAISSAGAPLFAQLTDASGKVTDVLVQSGNGGAFNLSLSNGSSDSASSSNQTMISLMPRGCYGPCA